MFKSTFLLQMVMATFLTSTSNASFKIKRKLLKAGFQRDLETELNLPRQFVKECGDSLLLLFETLPSGVYADPFHVQSQQQFGGPQVHFVETVNIEAAEFASEPLELYIYHNLSTISVADFDKDMLETRVVLPIHARYHKVPAATDATHATVSISKPHLYTNCSKRDQSDTDTLSAPCNARSSDLCSWHRLFYQSTTSHVTMTVPVGQAKHKSFVIIGTIGLSIFVSIALIKVIWSHEYNYHDKSS